MKHTKVTLVPLTADDREQFILDNQCSFKYGALEEFGERDDHIDGDGEIISRRTIERCIDDPQNEQKGIFKKFQDYPPRNFVSLYYNNSIYINFQDKFYLTN